ncbi:hypothetical protein DSAG12_01944 [Promethearchaeum syntrophicum]|uniref:DUF2268 domain-containing protein n=1 Tax=Promethearchaeum syntrophicum TaxID=2594042 RepID=A0A5B9DAV8_9ARCH
MKNWKIFDTFDDFEEIWSLMENADIENQIEIWKTLYMEKWPYILKMQIESYQNDGGDWKKIAKEHVFPKLKESVQYMKQVRNELKKAIKFVAPRALQKFQLDFPLNFVIYVGIGVGAGWATEFREKPAVLYGLENIIECGWKTFESLAPLSAHEIGHLIHFHWRKDRNLPIENHSPFWQLYEEGFAMRCEHKIMEEESWHQQMGQENWVLWCKSHLSYLAQKFLDESGDNNTEMQRNFFGSWFEIEGKKQTGYYLGHEIVKSWEEEGNFKEIALMKMDEIDEKVKKTLKFFC